MWPHEYNSPSLYEQIPEDVEVKQSASNDGQRPQPLKNSKGVAPLNCNAIYDVGEQTHKFHPIGQVVTSAVVGLNQELEDQIVQASEQAA